MKISEPNLLNDLRRLADHAAAGGADTRWLEAVSDQIVAALVELDRRGDQRPRTTLEKARRIATASASMADMDPGERMAALKERFRCSQQTISRLLRLAATYKL